MGTASPRDGRYSELSAYNVPVLVGPALIADAIEQRVARADKLTQTILAKAFRGERVPTESELARQEGRDYEPASILLERISRERANALAGRAAKRRPRTPRLL